MKSAAQFFEFVSGLVESDPAITCRWSQDRLKVSFPKNENSGFDIEVAYEPTSETLNLQTDHGYHDHFHTNQFESFSAALSNVFGLVRDLLSPNMRIVETRANGKPRKWQLQALVDGNWATEAKVGLLFWNVFGEKTTVEYINHVLPPREFNRGA